MIPILKNEWGVNDNLQSVQASMVFLGFLIGSLISGQICDRLGRKLPFLISSFFTCAVTLLTAAAQNIYQLIILRGCLGILVGFFGPLAITLMTEITPKEVRGRFMSIIQFSISVGQLFGLIVGFFTLTSLESGDWRMLIIITGLPGCLAWVAALFLIDESPMYLLSIKRKYEESFFILDKINAKNGRKSFEKLSEEQKIGLENWTTQIGSQQSSGSSGSLKQLFQGDNQFFTSVIWYTWFCLSFIYYGILVLLPYMIAENSKELNAEQTDINKNQGSEDLAKLTFSTISEMLSVLLAAIMIDNKKFGRKNSMIIFFFLASITSALVFITDKQYFYIWTLITKCFITMIMIFAYQFTAEIYNTKIRTTGIGTAIAVGKIGGIIMPWVCLGFMAVNLYSPFLIFSFLSLSVAIIDLFIPYDTLDRDLDQ